MKYIVFYGIGGQFEIMKPIALYNYDLTISHMIDRYKREYEGQEVFSDKCCGLQKRLDKDGVDYFCVTIGNPYAKERRLISERLEKWGLKPHLLAHKSTVTNYDLKLGKGLQISPRVTIGTKVKIGNWVILNQCCSIDHECILEDGVEIAPNATLCGCVTVKENAWICAGATVIPGVTIGENSIVGAGSVVLHDVPDNEIWVGNPARFLKKI